MTDTPFELFRQMCPKVLRDPEGKKQAMWAFSLAPCECAEQFRDEAIWVIFCSGISYRAARSMQEHYRSTGECRHPHKAAAIAKWEKNFRKWWAEYTPYTTDKERIDYLRTLPYMGGKALVYQLAKNLGITGYCKPDVHLIRLAKRYGYDDPQTMCEAIAEAYKHIGATVAYVDTILWFAAMKRWT